VTARRPCRSVESVRGRGLPRGRLNLLDEQAASPTRHFPNNLVALAIAKQRGPERSEHREPGGREIRLVRERERVRLHFAAPHIPYPYTCVHRDDIRWRFGRFDLDRARKLLGKFPDVRLVPYSVDSRPHERV